MSNIYKDAPVVKIVMLKGADGDKSKLSELQNDMTFLTEEQIITLVTNIVDSGSVGDIDTGFVTRLKEQNEGKQLQFWVGTQAEYNEIEIVQANTFYIITDDNFKEVTEQAIQALSDRIDAIEHTDYDEEISDLQTRTSLLTEDVEGLEQTTSLQGQDISDLEALINEGRYAIGDTDTIAFSVGGAMHVSNSSQNKVKMMFDIPLKKRIPSGAQLTLNGISISAVAATQYADGFVVGSRSGKIDYTSSSYTYTSYGTYIRVNLIAIASSNQFVSDVGVGIDGTASISISTGE